MEGDSCNMKKSYMFTLLIIVLLVFLTSCSNSNQQAQMNQGVIVAFEYSTHRGYTRVSDEVRFYIRVHGIDFAGNETVRKWRVTGEQFRTLNEGDLVSRIDNIVIKVRVLP